MNFLHFLFLVFLCLWGLLGDNFSWILHVSACLLSKRHVSLLSRISPFGTKLSRFGPLKDWGFLNSKLLTIKLDNSISPCRAGEAREAMWTGSSCCLPCLEFSCTFSQLLWKCGRLTCELASRVTSWALHSSWQGLAYLKGSHSIWWEKLCIN